MMMMRRILMMREMKMIMIMMIMIAIQYSFKQFTDFHKHLV